MIPIGNGPWSVPNWGMKLFSIQQTRTKHAWDENGVGEQWERRAYCLIGLESTRFSLRCFSNHRLMGAGLVEG